MRKALIVVLILLVLLSKGGADKSEIEKMSLWLIIGIDLDQDNNLVVSASGPIFDKEAKIKEEEATVRTITLRKGRDEIDKTFMGLGVGGKVQEFLIGKRVLQHPGWFRLLEPILRDPRNTVRGRIAMVDGPVIDVISYKPEDKPRLPLYLTNLIDTAYHRNITVKTMLQDLRRANYEKGMTASLTELRKGKRLNVTGSVLLDEQGKFRLSIGADENKLLRILQHETGGEFSFTFRAPDQPKDEAIPSDTYSFSIEKVQVKTKTDYLDGRFKFDVRIKMRAVLTELMFPLDLPGQTGKLEQYIAQEMEERFDRFIRKIQAKKIDPVGFGLYARAHEYRRWKEVEDRWGEALSKADVNVKVRATLIGTGLTK